MRWSAILARKLIGLKPWPTLTALFILQPYQFRPKAVLDKKQSGEESENIKFEIIRQQQGEAAWGTRAGHDIGHELLDSNIITYYKRNFSG